MGLSTEVLFTADLGLQSPWRVERADLSVAKKRIDFDVICTERRLACPHCGAPDQGIHERIQRSWRHLDLLHSQQELDAIADLLNNRPRAIHGFYPPIAVYQAMLDKLNQPNSSIQ